MHIPSPEGVVAIVAGVEKAREAGVLMLEELEHEVAENRLGKRRRHVVC